MESSSLMCRISERLCRRNQRCSKIPGHLESISKTPIKVVFENNPVKKAMLVGDSRFSSPWHELAYLVDVRIQTVQGITKVYSIFNYHDDEKFNPSE